MKKKLRRLSGKNKFLILRYTSHIRELSQTKMSPAKKFIIGTELVVAFLPFNIIALRYLFEFFQFQKFEILTPVAVGLTALVFMLYLNSDSPKADITLFILSIIFIVIYFIWLITYECGGANPGVGWASGQACLGFIFPILLILATLPLFFTTGLDVWYKNKYKNETG